MKIKLYLMSKFLSLPGLRNSIALTHFWPLYQPLMPPWHQRAMQKFVARLPITSSSLSNIWTDNKSGLDLLIISISATSLYSHVRKTILLQSPFHLEKNGLSRQNSFRSKAFIPYFGHGDQFVEKKNLDFFSNPQQLKLTAHNKIRQMATNQFEI